jgi:outer membrane protein assembly factor BamB
MALLWIVSNAVAQDWPQWRGPNRDAKTNSFNAPESWPAELKQKWKVTVGDGVATPAVVGERVFVFTREGDQEVIRCLNAATGDQVWKNQYEADPIRGPAGSFGGPRSSPTVADGKVVTLGVQGTLGCYDATTGEQLWRKDEFANAVPRFSTSSSPIAVAGICIAQLGEEEDGGVIAFDLAGGDERWRWDADGPAYGSPVLMTVDGTQLIVMPTNKNLVALGLDGKLLWEMPYSQGRYNSETPVVSGDMLIVAGPDTGVTAFRLKKNGGQLVEEKLWSNSDNSLQFNTPVLKGNLLIGLSTAGQLFCINTQDPESTAWTAPLTQPQQRPVGAEAGRGVENSRENRVRAIFVQAVQQDERRREGRGDRPGFDRERRRGEGRGEGGRRFGGRRRGGGRGGYGSVVDAGSVLLALSPAGELVVFKPSAEAFSEVARFKVANEGTYAYPVAVGNAIYIKDRDSLTRWGVE